MNEADGVHTWLLLWRTTRAVEAHARASVAKLGLCGSDFGVLEALLHKGPLPVNELGRKVLLTSGSMTAAVDRLEARGLARRRGDPEDRRARVVHLTAKGRGLALRMFAAHRADMERAVSGLSAGERAALNGLLRKLGRGAQSLLNREGDKR